MSTPSIALKRITLYKNDLGYFERDTARDQTPSVLVVAKKHKKLVIDTLCTTASAVTFDTEEHDQYVAGSSVEPFFTFADLSSTSSFATFLQSCIGAEVAFLVQGDKTRHVGQLVMLDEHPVLLGPNCSETTTQYILRILTQDGFIRHFPREWLSLATTRSFSSSLSKYNRRNSTDRHLFTTSIRESPEQNARQSQTIDERRFGSHPNLVQEWATCSCHKQCIDNVDWCHAIESLVLLRNKRMALSLSMWDRFVGIECVSTEDWFDSFRFSEESYRRGLVTSRIAPRGERIGDSEQQQNYHDSNNSRRITTRRKSILRWNAGLHQNINRQNHHHWRKSSGNNEENFVFTWFSLLLGWGFGFDR